MAIEQEWKNPKKRNRNIVIAIAIILLIWWFCGFGGPKPWAINLNSQLGDYSCPSKCWLNNTSDGGGNNEEIPSDTCPPISSRFQARNPDLYNQLSQLCTSGSGTFTHNDYELSCEIPTGGIDCEGAGLGVVMYECHELGAVYHCQDNWAGCYCPGSGPIPYGAPKKCDKTYSWEFGNPSSSCTGPCDEGETCKDMNGYCACAQSEIYDCSWSGGQIQEYMCGGDCPDGKCSVFTDEQGLIVCGCRNYPQYNEPYLPF